MLHALKLYPSKALHYASDELKKDRKFMLAAVRQHGYVCVFTVPSLHHSLSHRGRYALHWASNDLKDDHDVVLAAILQNRLALCYASGRLKGCPEISQVAKMRR